MAIHPRAFSVNQRISHNVFGLGAIKEIDEVYTVIDFDEGSQRKFLTRMVELTPSSAPVPPRPVLEPSKKKRSARKK